MNCASVSLCIDEAYSSTIYFMQVAGAAQDATQRSTSLRKADEYFYFIRTQDEVYCLEVYVIFISCGPTQIRWTNELR